MGLPAAQSWQLASVAPSGVCWSRNPRRLNVSWDVSSSMSGRTRRLPASRRYGTEEPGPVARRGSSSCNGVDRRSRWRDTNPGREWRLQPSARSSPGFSCLSCCSALAAVQNNRYGSSLEVWVRVMRPAALRFSGHPNDVGLPHVSPGQASSRSVICDHLPVGYTRKRESMLYPAPTEGWRDFIVRFRSAGNGETCTARRPRWLSVWSWPV